MPLALLQIAAEEAEKSKVPFFVAGGLFAAWAIVLFVVGMRTQSFPGLGPTAKGAPASLTSKVPQRCHTVSSPRLS